MPPRGRMPQTRRDWFAYWTSFALAPLVGWFAFRQGRAYYVWHHVRPGHDYRFKELAGRAQRAIALAELMPLDDQIAKSLGKSVGD
jgi:hypothetical protein